MLYDKKILMLYDAVIVTLFVVLPYVTKIRNHKRTQMNFTLNPSPSSSLSPEKNKNISIDVRCVCMCLSLYLYSNTLYIFRSANSKQSCPGPRLKMYINYKTRIYSYLIDKYKFMCQIYK